MASYLDLVNSIIVSQRMRTVERNGRLALNRAGNLRFNELLRKSMDQKEQKALQGKGIPLRRDLADTSGTTPADEGQRFTECLNFVLAKEGSRYVHEDGGKESSRYGILQSTARELG